MAEVVIPDATTPLRPNPIRVYNLHIEHSFDHVVYTVPFFSQRKAENYAQAHAAFHWPEEQGRCPTLQWGMHVPIGMLPPNSDRANAPPCVRVSSAISRPLGMNHGAVKFVITEWEL